MIYHWEVYVPDKIRSMDTILKFMCLYHVYQLSYLIFEVILQGHLHMVEFGGATTFLQLTWAQRTTESNTLQDTSHPWWTAWRVTKN